MLQLPVLVFQLLQFLRIPTVHPAVLRLPAVVSLLRDPVLSAQLRRCQSCLALLQDFDDLLFAVSLAFYFGSPLLGLGELTFTTPTAIAIINKLCLLSAPAAKSWCALSAPAASCAIPLRGGAPDQGEKRDTACRGNPLSRSDNVRRATAPVHPHPAPFLIVGER